MLIGLFKAIRRVLISAALNLFYLSRLDTPLTVKGWEFLDKGTIHRIYSYTYFIISPLHNSLCFLHCNFEIGCCLQ